MSEEGWLLFDVYWIRCFRSERSPNTLMKHGALAIVNPDIKVHGANMGPIWSRQDPGGTHVGPINFAIWEYIIVCDVMA